MTKDKKSKKEKKKNKDHKASKPRPRSALAKAPKKAASSLQALTHNPLVADVVAAALVSMAAALKDSDKARRLANDAGEQLSTLSKKTAKQGNVMWDLALDVGRRALDAIATEEPGGSKPRRK